ncbi:GNAT family N-acetyltransferase [Aliifodinibius sp. S!AR15-10]|uniref:GNAT family N-acetyltransferase n=1 Tax=Aliifodinibius sp. S!AR15-10 TaxID=2950437 RepID=UPI00285847F7|nr:GNAT family protein [Aliifodinibius sp. S!AR15-10]MDR8391115.1 GNAT family N-acetyltransferase [Aliifodinibius sp. S!AR15-10]
MVKIKPFDQQNVALHYKWNNDEEVNYYSSEDSPQVESFNAFLRRVKTVLDERNEKADLFEIHLSENDKLIGIVDIHDIDLHNRRCHVKCTIGDRKYAGQNYETAALRKILAYCFKELGMHKVTTAAYDFDTTWIKEVQKLGFKKEGLLRDHAVKGETYCDKLIFGLLSEEYKQSQKSSELRVAN